MVDCTIYPFSSFYDFYKNYNFEKIYISNLKRTFLTVKEFINDGIIYEKLSEFNEISWGINQGKSNNLDVYKRLTDSWAEGNLNNKFKGGESPNEIAVRLNEGINHIINENFNKILICIHGRALRVLLSLILDKDLTRMDNYLHSNTCLYIIYYDRGKFILKEKNNTDHLT